MDSKHGLIMSHDGRLGFELDGQFYPVIAGGAGTDLSSPPVSLLNTMNGMTQKYIAPDLVDAVGRPSPTFWRATRQGRKVQGGGSILWSVISSEEAQGGAYWGSQILDTSISDSAQPAELQWRFYYESIVIPTTDLDMNAGPEAVLSLVKAKEEIAMMSLLQKIARSMYGTAPQNTSIDTDGITEALGALGGTYAGITIGTGFWASNGLAGPTSNTSNLALSILQTAYGQATFGNEEPDTVITTQAGFNAFINLLTNNQRYFDEETTRAGFKNHLMYNSAVVLHDQFTPTGEFEILTSKYFNPVFLNTNNFRVRPFVMPSVQEIVVSRITVAWNLKFDTLRQHSRITGIADA